MSAAALAHPATSPPSARPAPDRPFCANARPRAARGRRPVVWPCSRRRAVLCSRLVIEIASAWGPLTSDFMRAGTCRSREVLLVGAAGCWLARASVCGSGQLPAARIPPHRGTSARATPSWGGGVAAEARRASERACRWGGMEELDWRGVRTLSKVSTRRRRLIFALGKVVGRRRARVVASRWEGGVWQ